ncbi:MAG: TIGR00725 family protein [Desulfosarcina sp.]|nr:TIGR00725 family protein [Desulfobacterales bacterium]
MSKFIVGVMGPGDRARTEDVAAAYKLGRLIAKEEWALLSGGRNAGVMDAASRGAKEAGGLTIGIMPALDKESVSPSVEIPIFTGMGSARNSINVLTSDVVIACGMGIGTASEVALAFKAGKHVVLLNSTVESKKFFKSLGYDALYFADTPKETIRIIKELKK